MKRKFFPVCLCLCLCIALFSGVFAVMGWGDLLRQVGGTILYPFQWTGARISDGIRGLSHYFEDLDGMSGEIESLREENQSLRDEIRDAQILREEYGWLYGYLDMKKEHQTYEFCAATVTARSVSDGYALELTLNKGSYHGVKEGMPVVTGEGLIGVVCEVNLMHCKVKTVIHTSFSVGAVVARSGETGLCEGDYTTLPGGEAVLRHLDSRADVVEGDVVLTSGRGDIYPYGLPIGYVASVTYNAYSRTMEAVIHPFPDLSDVDQVLILTRFDRFAEGYGPEEASS